MQPARATARLPFWMLTMFSVTLMLLASIANLVIYLRTSQWQYLAVSGISLFSILVHILAWGWTASHRQYPTGIWAIIAAQILTALLVPLFYESYWLIGLFPLVLAPLEAGLVDNLRRIPLAIVLSLLAAAGMLLFDLWAPFARVAALEPASGAFALATSLFILQLGMLAGLLWIIRRHHTGAIYPQLDLATQLSLVFTGLSAMTTVVVLGVLIAQIRSSQIEQVGENFRTLALINAERVGNSLNEQIDSLLAMGRQNTILQEALAKANAAYPASNKAALAQVLQAEQSWQAAPDSSQLVLGRRSSPEAIELSKYRGADLLHNNLLITDRLGGLVAVQGARPAHYYFGSQEWWQVAWNEGQGGIYLGDLQIDPGSGKATVFIAVSILDPKTNKIIGILASTYALSAIQREIQRAQERISGEIALITATGVVIAGKAGQEGQSIGTPLWQQTPPLTLAQSSWRLGRDYLQRDAVIAYAPLDTTTGVNLDTLQSLHWSTIVNETRSAALAEVNRSIKVTTLVGVLVMIVIVIIASSVAQLLTRPIDALTETAVTISQGNLEKRARLAGPVELMTLAEAFNTLASSLQLLINNLQDQVAERTVQLQARADELLTLNRIQQSVASDLNLRQTLGIVAREMGELFGVNYTGIALLDRQRTHLTIVAEYLRDSHSPSTLNLTIPVSEDIASSRVIESRKTIARLQAQAGGLPGAALKENAAEPEHELVDLRGVCSMMIVPLMARGEVIGTIDITSDDEKREFTPSDVQLAETIAGQIAGTIENARLFSEMQSAKEAAEAANESKSAFLASVSHELRTPLTSVLGFSKIVQKRLSERIFPGVVSDDPQTQRAMSQVSQNLNIMIAEGERLTSMINNVLDLSKIEAGKIEWVVQPLQVSEVIARAVSATAGLLQSRPGVELYMQVDEDLPQINGDRDKLIQVVINLISNAVKFTPQGSITCQARLAGDEILVCVADTGVGIPAEFRHKVFEKFTQLGDTLTDKPQGTGLGLSICKEIVEHHGGRIWVESQLGQGSQFFFTLPVTLPAGRSQD